MNSHLLACPLCQQALTAGSQQVVCSQGHSFDRARQGYLHLLPVQYKKSRQPGDSKAMVAARQRFLQQGHYRPLADALVERLAKFGDLNQPLRLFDAGCGEGYYLNYLVEQLQQRWPERAIDAVGLDISKEAILAACRYPSPIQWLVGTNAHLPLRDAQFDVVLCLFGFPCYAEFARVLKPNALLLQLDPGPDHLLELRRIIYPDLRPATVANWSQAEQAGFRLAAEQPCRYRTQALDQEQIHDLLSMTPHLFRATYEGKQAVQQLSQLPVQLDVCLRELVLDTPTKTDLS